MTQMVLTGTDVILIVFLKSVATINFNLEKIVTTAIHLAGMVAILTVEKRFAVTASNKLMNNVITPAQMGTDAILTVSLKSVVITSFSLGKNAMMETLQMGTAVILYALKKVYALMAKYNPSMSHVMITTQSTGTDVIQPVSLKFVVMANFNQVNNAMIITRIMEIHVTQIVSLRFAETIRYNLVRHVTTIPPIQTGTDVIQLAFLKSVVITNFNLVKDVTMVTLQTGTDAIQLV